jgi:tetratricopeptide (TPR) repeat protein
MSSDPAKPPKGKNLPVTKTQPPNLTPEKKSPPPPPAAPQTPGEAPALFRRIDWLTFMVAALLVFAGYYYTLAPDLTLEDCGELAVGSFYAGVPHPPGYPVWTICSHLFTLLVPFSNVAWRVALMSAVSGALACGLIGLMVSRGSSMMIESIAQFKQIDRRWENAICLVSGLVAAMLFGYNGYVWSQAVIVEVYVFSVLSLVGVLCLLLRWLYAPHQLRYLYWGAFLFGICLTNHQTLVVAIMGIEVLVLAARPPLGRDLFFANSLCYIGGLVLKANGTITSFDGNLPLFFIFNAIGLWSMITCAWAEIRDRRQSKWMTLLAYFLGSLFLALLWVLNVSKGRTESAKGIETFYIAYQSLAMASLAVYSWTRQQPEPMLANWLPVLAITFLAALGASFYFYMPLTSMTNPPMNWGYPRTWDGFIHAFTRGQYERTNPTNIFTDPERFINQLWLYIDGALAEYNAVYLLIALVPFLFYSLMQKRERAWVSGLTANFFFLSVLLLMLLNPNTDRQSRDLVRVFFGASHVIISMGVGYGLTIIAAAMSTQYERYRFWGLVGSAVATSIALFVVSIVFRTETSSGPLNVSMFGVEPSQNPLVRATALFSLTLAAAAIALFAFSRRRVLMVPLLALFALLPTWSILSHWSDNEQRGHLFGYWFGHDMFRPPFQDKDGKPLYPEMARDAVLFGGTDPGRFCPTYMIFCESFIPPRCKPRDRTFDRRDVYIITQNALADGTYLSYIRAHYNRSAQVDTPFFQEMLRPNKERAEADPLKQRTNALARAVAPIDRFFTRLGRKIEDRRRASGVYPKEEIYTPTPADADLCYKTYIEDAGRRQMHDEQFPLEPKQIKPGEDVRVVGGRVQVSGQVAVMAINGLLTKIIFDKNPGHEFYVEESFPLEWMYPYLEPFGIIMKINRQPLNTLTEEVLRRDHEFWSQYSQRLIGNWITYDTPLKDICQFISRVYERRDYAGFTGDSKFIRDDQAQKSFSKLRSSIAGVYAWRVGPDCPPEYRPKSADEYQRILKEADFAFRQAFAFCPYSPEAVFRYAQLLANQNRFEEARLLAATCLKLDPYSASVQSLLNSLDSLVKRQENVAQAQTQLGTLERIYRSNPTNLSNAFALVTAYLQLQQSNQALQILDNLMNSPNVDAATLMNVAFACSQLMQVGRLEVALNRLVQLVPGNPEAWYDLAVTQATLGKTKEALDSLGRAVLLSAQRLASQPNAKDLRTYATQDPRFTHLRNLPEFQQLVRAPEKK